MTKKLGIVLFILLANAACQTFQGTANSPKTAPTVGQMFEARNN